MNEKSNSAVGSYSLFVDPGLRGCGCALFRDNRLWAAAYVRSSETQGRGIRSATVMARHVIGWVQSHLQLDMTGLATVVIEFPRIYPGYKSDIDPNDLLDLAAVGGAIAVYFTKGAISHVFPSEWKGQVPKKVMNERVKNALDVGERQVIDSVGAKDHNTYDAVGIGLNFFGRLTKKVYA